MGTSSGWVSVAIASVWFPGLTLSDSYAVASRLPSSAKMRMVTSGEPPPKYLIRHRGEMWPRNIANINPILGSKEGGQGIYILFDGSIPVYVGRGKIRQRIRQASKSKRRGQSWDHFSWYVVPTTQNEQELEALSLRMLPPHLRMPNRQRGSLLGATKRSCKDKRPEPIERPHTFGGKSKRG
jgi:hypothetical protein